ncbi:unnamed protein product [Closterium sp. NIES-64]|nr:unnamed protein product [Closterium sp. NIES-64]
MAARGVQEYVAAVSRAVDAKDGEALAALLRVFRPGYPEAVTSGLDHVRVRVEAPKQLRSLRENSAFNNFSKPAMANPRTSPCAVPCRSHPPQDMARLLSRVPERLGEMLLPLMQAMAAIQRHQFTDAFGEMLQAANLFLPVLRNWEGTWALPPLHAVVHDLRVLAEKADMEQRAAGKSPDKLKAAASFLMKVFGAIAGKGPKKVGSLYVACQLFKIYFKLGTLNLSKSIIRVIDSSKGFDDYPARDQVLPPPLSPSSSHACLPVPVPPVCLFVLLVTSTSSLTLILSCLLACPGAACLPLLPPGVCDDAAPAFSLFLRLHSNKSKSSLTRAPSVCCTSTSSLTLILSCLLACPGAACLPLLPPGVCDDAAPAFSLFLRLHSNKSKSSLTRAPRILRYLIPVRLSLGHLPSPELLRNHHLQEYEGIVQAMRTGDVRLLRDTLSANEDRFLRAGVYLLLEKLELHVYRRLIRKIHVLQRAKDPARAHQVRLEVVVRALAGRGVAVDVDELEGLVATLIALGFVKGYLSHKSKVVVLSKQDPFPRLTGRVLL